jgi:hypothetical protein
LKFFYYIYYIAYMQFMLQMHGFKMPVLAGHPVA